MRDRPRRGRGRAAARRPPPQRGTPRAGERQPARAHTRLGVGPRSRERGSRGARRRADGRGPRDLLRASNGPARLRGQERLRARRTGAVRGHRLGSGGPDRGRRPRAGAGHLREHALALLLGGHPRGRASDRPEPRRGAPRAADRRPDEGLRRRARGGLRRPRARHHRGEPPGADAREHRDGAVEQVRVAGPHHGQQVGDVGGLRDPLRRHGRRLRRAEGRLQGPRLPAGPLAQRAGGA